MLIVLYSVRFLQLLSELLDRASVSATGRKSPIKTSALASCGSAGVNFLFLSLSGDSLRLSSKAPAACCVYTGLVSQLGHAVSGTHCSTVYIQLLLH